MVEHSRSYSKMPTSSPAPSQHQGWTDVAAAAASAFSSSASSTASLQDRLVALSRAPRSAFLVLQHNVSTARRPSLEPQTATATPRTPASVPTSPSVGSSLNVESYGVNAVVVDEGTLEEDGGLDGLRRRLIIGEVQYVFLKFRGEIVFVQCLCEGMSAASRARSMVIGRSLMSQTPTTTPPSITVTHPQQLTDLLLRSKVGPWQRSRSFLHENMTPSFASTPCLSESKSASPFSPSYFQEPHDQAPCRVSPEQADVPVSVSFNNPSSPLDETNKCDSAHRSSGVHTRHSYLSSSSNPEPKTPSSIAVGFGMGNVGLNIISPLQDLFGHDTGLRAQGAPSTPLSPTPPPKGAERLTRSSSDLVHAAGSPSTTTYTEREPSVASSSRERLSTNSADASPAVHLTDAFPVPPVRTSMQETNEHHPAVIAASGVGVDKGSFNSSDVPRRRKPSRLQESRYPILLHSHKQQRSLPESPNSPLYDEGAMSFAQQPEGQRHFHSQSSETISPRRESFSSASVMSTTSSILYNGTSFGGSEVEAASTTRHKRQDTLERERLDFLQWRAEQEAHMVAKERVRERARRAADEAKREQVMRRLMIEQSEDAGELTGAEESLRPTTRATRSIHSHNGTEASRSSQSPTTLSTLPRSPQGSSTRSPGSFSTTTGTSGQMQAKRSSPLLPPREPPPRMPDSSRSSGSHPTASGAVGNRGERKERRSDSSRASLRGTAPFSSPMIKPLDDRVRSAIEREMRRPVITMEGHVRPRVNRARAKSSAAVNERDRKQAIAASAGQAYEESMNPLLLSILREKMRNDEKTMESLAERVPTNADREHIAMRPGSRDTLSSTQQVRTLYPNGRAVGSGWALALAEEDRLAHDKDLPMPPPPPPSSFWSSEDLSKAENGVPEMHEWQKVFESLLRGVEPASTMAVIRTGQRDDRKRSLTCDTSMTLIDQVFQQKVNAQPAGTSSSPSSSLSSAESIDDAAKGMSNEEQIRALHARQDVLEAMLHALHRKRTIRSEHERRARERWSRQSAVRATMSDKERRQAEKEEQERREQTAKEEEEEEKNVRIITLILLPEKEAGSNDSAAV